MLGLNCKLCPRGTPSTIAPSSLGPRLTCFLNCMGLGLSPPVRSLLRPRCSWHRPLIRLPCSSWWRTGCQACGLLHQCRGSCPPLLRRAKPTSSLPARELWERTRAVEHAAFPGNLTRRPLPCCRAPCRSTATCRPCLPAGWNVFVSPLNFLVALSSYV